MWHGVPGCRCITYGTSTDWKPACPESRVARDRRVPHTLQGVLAWPQKPVRDGGRVGTAGIPGLTPGAMRVSPSARAQPANTESAVHTHGLPATTVPSLCGRFSAVATEAGERRG
jgi:hypothetical protein